MKIMFKIIKFKNVPQLARLYTEVINGNFKKYFVSKLYTT